MRSINRFEIRQELNVLEQALFGERFLKDTDPSISIMNFIEQVSSEMGAIKHLYSKGAADRNEIVKPMQEKLDNLKAIIASLEQSLTTSTDDPEDTNDALPADKDS